MNAVEKTLKLYRERGDSEYGGEPVTQLEHALQCAMLAENENASPALIAAALLHDVGHLLHDVGHLLHQLPDDAPGQGVDDAHEELGYRYLAQTFGDAVAEPVRLHVPAKRYLCATDSEYFAKLSEPSVVSLKLQGGSMTDTEVAEFNANPFAEDAVRLRQWDDEAKIAGLETPPLEHFAQYLEAVCTR